MDLERSIITKMCEIGDAGQVIEAGIGPEDFLDHTSGNPATLYRDIFAWVMEINEGYGKPPTVDELAEEFPDYKPVLVPKPMSFYVDEHRLAKERVAFYHVLDPALDLMHEGRMAEGRALIAGWVSSNGHGANGHPELLRASDIEEVPVTWLWRDRIPLGAGTLFEGDGGAGKTTVLCDIIARTTTGEPWPDSVVEREPRNVVIFTAEDSAAKVLRPRLRLAGADLDRVFFAPEVISLPRDVAVFEAWIKAVEAALVLMDPLSAYLSLTGGKSWDEPSVRQALRPVFEVADRHEVAVLGIRHLNKATEMKAAYRGLGSVGFNAFARSVHLAGPDPRDPSRSVLACTKSNWAAKPPSLAYEIVEEENGVTLVEWLGTTELTSDELLQPARPTRESVAQRCARDLEQLLRVSGNPRFAQDIYEELMPLGYTRNALRDARYLLRLEVTGDGKGIKWALPDDLEEE